MGLKKFDNKIKNSKKKPIIVASIIVVALIVGINIFVTYADYKATKSYNILKGQVREFKTGDLIIALKVVDKDGNETTVNDFPDSSEYTFDTEKSYCENGTTINYVKGNISVDKVAGKDKCILYFRTFGTAAETIISNAKTNNYFIETDPEFGTETANGEYGLYSASDDLGTSYYFRGDVPTNYVKFGKWSETDTSGSAGKDMYWRIVRINGDGSIRMIYDGTEALENGTAHTGSITTSEFNIDNGLDEHVGYTYINKSGTKTDSTIKQVLENWYDTNLSSNYGDYIADNIFCNNRVIAEYKYYDINDNLVDSIANASHYIKYYDTQFRVYNNNNPQLSCDNIADAYTSSISLGNGENKNPIGLITADEVMMAGGTSVGSNNSYYLYVGANYWSISPVRYNTKEKTATVSITSSDEKLFADTVSAKHEVRPVINLKANITLTGEGTKDVPYEIVAE